MALLFQPRSRAVHVLMFAVLGAGVVASAVQGQSPAPAPAKAASSLVPDPDDGGLTLPEGFRAVVVADALKNGDVTGAIRFLAVAANGDVYVKTAKGGIIALRDTNGDGCADVKETFGEGGGSGIACATAISYHSSTSAVYRYKLTPGELVPTSTQELVVSGLSRRAAAQLQVLRLRAGRPALRRGRLSLQCLRRTQGPRPGGQGRGPDGVPEDARRLVALRSQQAQPDPGRRLPLLDRPSPHVVHRLEPGLEELLRACRWGATT